MSLIAAITMFVFTPINDPHTEVSLQYSSFPLAKYSSADSEGRWTVSISRESRAEGQKITDRSEFSFIATRFRGGYNGIQIGQANSINCPKLVGVVAAINNLFAPRFDLGPPFGVMPEDSGIRPILPSPLDGRTFVIEGRARQADGSFARMEVAASSGLIFELGLFSEDAMKDCWQEPS